MNAASAHLTVLYTCAPCGIHDREVIVPARGDEDVVQWLEGPCMGALARDHQSASPGCRATTLTELKIPMSGTDKVGGVVRQ